MASGLRTAKYANLRNNIENDNESNIDFRSNYDNKLQSEHFNKSEPERQRNFNNEDTLFSDSSFNDDYLKTYLDEVNQYNAINNYNGLTTTQNNLFNQMQQQPSPVNYNQAPQGYNDNTVSMPYLRPDDISNEVHRLANQQQNYNTMQNVTPFQMNNDNNQRYNTMHNGFNPNNPYNNPPREQLFNETQNIQITDRNPNAGRNPKNGRNPNDGRNPNNGQTQQFKPRKPMNGNNEDDFDKLRKTQKKENNRKPLAPTNKVNKTINVFLNIFIIIMLAVVVFMVFLILKQRGVI